MRFRVVIAAAFALLYLYSFPYFDGLRSANELPRIFLTTEMVDHATFRIDGRMRELGSTFDVATTPDGHHYSNKAPGLSFLAVPVYVGLKLWYGVSGGEPSLAATTWAFRVFAVTLPSLCFLLVFVGVARRFATALPQGPKRHRKRARPAETALCAYALGSMALPYGMLFFSHQPAAAFAGSAFALAVHLCRGQPSRPDLCAAGVGALAGLAVLTDYQSAIAGAAVGVYLLARAPGRVRCGALAVAGSLPFAAALLWYHNACFGGPFVTGYAFSPDPAHDAGLLGIVGPNATALHQALIAPDNGLLVVSPWILVAVLGAASIARDPGARAAVGAEAICAGAIVVLYVLFVGSLVPEFGRAGWSVGPRYIACALPFAGWLAAAGFAWTERYPSFRVLSWAAVLTGVAVYVAAANTYPHWPTSFANPIHDVAFRLIGRGMAPHSLGTAIGLRGVFAFLPVFAAAAALSAWLLAGAARGRWLGLTMALVLTSAALVAYRGFAPAADARARPWKFIERTWEPRARPVASPDLRW